VLVELIVECLNLLLHFRFSGNGEGLKLVDFLAHAIDHLTTGHLLKGQVKVVSAHQVMSYLLLQLMNLLF